VFRYIYLAIVDYHILMCRFDVGKYHKIAWNCM